MAIKTFRPKTHSLRFKTVIDYKQELTTDQPHKPLLEPKNRINGRNNYGQLTVRHRGGGNKKHYRIIDFKRDKVGIPAKVETIEYDPNRSAFIALLSYADGERRYILQPVGLKVGMSVVSGSGSRHPCRQCAAVEKYSARHDGSQHRAASRQGRADGAQRRSGGAACCEGRRVRSREAAFR